MFPNRARGFLCTRIYRTLAEAGNAVGQYSLSSLLTDKEHSGYNPSEGIKWLRKSAAQNFVHAQTVLGLRYYEGLDDIIPQDFKRARHWFNRAAKQENRTAQYHLGEI